MPHAAKSQPEFILDLSNEGVVLSRQPAHGAAKEMGRLSLEEATPEALRALCASAGMRMKNPEVIARVPRSEVLLTKLSLKGASGREAQPQARELVARLTGQPAASFAVDLLQNEKTPQASVAAASHATLFEAWKFCAQAGLTPQFYTYTPSPAKPHSWMPVFHYKPDAKAAAAALPKPARRAAAMPVGAKPLGALAALLLALGLWWWGGFTPDAPREVSPGATPLALSSDPQITHTDAPVVGGGIVAQHAPTPPQALRVAQFGPQGSPLSLAIERATQSPTRIESPAAENLAEDALQPEEQAPPPQAVVAVESPAPAPPPDPTPPASDTSAEAPVAAPIEETEEAAPKPPVEEPAAAPIALALTTEPRFQRPPLLPARAQTTTAEAPVAEASVATSEDATAPAEDTAPETGATPPQPRPNDLSEIAALILQAEEEAAAAMASAPAPALRPGNFEAIVDAAENEAEPQPAPQPAAPSTGTRSTTPVSVDVARVVTVETNYNDRKTQLLGLMGRSGAMRALVQFKNGEVKSLGVGDKIEGWSITAITSDGVRLVKGSRTQIMQIPR